MFLWIVWAPSDPFQSGGAIRPSVRNSSYFLGGAEWHDYDCDACSGGKGSSEGRGKSRQHSLPPRPRQRSSSRTRAQTPSGSLASSASRRRRSAKTSDSVFAQARQMVQAQPRERGRDALTGQIHLLGSEQTPTMMVYGSPCGPCLQHGGLT